MSWRRIFLGVLVAGCGPKLLVDPEGSESTATSEASSQPGDDDATSGPTSEPPLELTPDEQYCLDRCLHFQATECPYSGETCFGDCLESLEWLKTDPCAAQVQASNECELLHPLDEVCEAAECRDVYLEEDVCHGFCWHFGGYPSSGASPEDCEWEGETCYGHDLEVRCTVGAGSQCSCRADGLEIGTCAPEVPLKAFDCGGQDMHIFTSCCLPMFLEVIG